MRSDFGSSTLVRLLGDWTPVEADASAMDFAERLSLWLNAFDAIGLQAAHQAIRAIDAPAPARPRSGRAPTAADLAADVQRVRGALAHAIAQSPSPLDLAEAEDGSFQPYHHRHLALQRQMEQLISGLRDHVRQAISRASTALRQLAALDAALEQTLAAREQALMPTTAGLLQRRFEQLRQAHRQALDAAGAPDDPARWRAPGGWLAAFEPQWREALLAEVDLRLEPVKGLVEALDNASKQQA
ncbi:DUF3348 family protein [Ramlibacter sp. MAHUQ-53]|uniref:DUF3348 family protein n=1 Tax=unclassified Ramlibacter TaxID=2617605 RepID=UPI00363FD4F6